MSVQQKSLEKKWASKKFDPLYLFYGPEDFLIDELVKTLLKKSIQKEEQDFNLDIFYGSEAEASQIVNAASAYPMMAERRAVVVKNAHLIDRSGIDLLAKYAAKPAASTILILTAPSIGRAGGWNQIKKNAVVFQAKPLYENRIPDWIRSHLSKRRVTISNQAIQLLQVSAGTSLRNLSTELDKILTHIGDEKHIDVEHVEKVVGISRQYNIFELCDAVGHKNLSASLHILNNMLQLGESPVGILTMLIRHYFILSKLLEMEIKRIRQDEMARALKVHPYFLKNYRNQVRKYNKEELRSAYNHLLQADHHLKTSYQKPKLVLELLLIKLTTAE